MRLPDAHFGTAESKAPDWRDAPDDDPDDTETETPKDVVMMLGFDPAKDERAARLDAVAEDCARLEGRVDALVEGRATTKQPYGDENSYADPGYQEDRKKRYPLGSVEEIRAAWNYIHKGRDADKYSATHLKDIKSRILRAWKEKIGGEPPEAK